MLVVVATISSVTFYTTKDIYLWVFQNLVIAYSNYKPKPYVYVSNNAKSFSTGWIHLAQPWEKYANDSWTCFTWQTYEQRDHQLSYYTFSVLLFILYGCHFTFKWIANNNQLSVCFCSHNIIQKSVSCFYLQHWIEIVKYALEQWVFMYNSYVKNMSHKLYERRLHGKYPGVWVPASSMLFELVKKVRSAGSFLDKKLH
jgi:hypothetical protein